MDTKDPALILVKRFSVSYATSLVLVQSVDLALANSGIQVTCTDTPRLIINPFPAMVVQQVPRNPWCAA